MFALGMFARGVLRGGGLTRMRRNVVKHTPPIEEEQQGFRSHNDQPDSIRRRGELRTGQAPVVAVIVESPGASPGVTTPGVTTPGVTTPGVLTTPGVTTPGVTTLGVTPDVTTLGVTPDAGLGACSRIPGDADLIPQAAKPTVVGRGIFTCICIM